MNDSVVEMCLSDDVRNHELFLTFLENNLVSMNEIIKAIIRKFKHDVKFSEVNHINYIFLSGVKFQFILRSNKHIKLIEMIVTPAKQNFDQLNHEYTFKLSEFKQERQKVFFDSENYIIRKNFLELINTCIEQVKEHIT